MHVASVPAPATECHALRVRPTRAHSRPPVARAVIPVGFCFALRERACADPQTSRSHVVPSERQRKPSPGRPLGQLSGSEPSRGPCCEARPPPGQSQLSSSEVSASREATVLHYASTRVRTMSPV